MPIQMSNARSYGIACGFGALSGAFGGVCVCGGRLRLPLSPKTFFIGAAAGAVFSLIREFFQAEKDESDLQIIKRAFVTGFLGGGFTYFMVASMYPDAILSESQRSIINQRDCHVTRSTTPHWVQKYKETGKNVLFIYL